MSGINPAYYSQWRTADLHEWRSVTEFSRAPDAVESERTYRLTVPTGWLYRFERRVLETDENGRRSWKLEYSVMTFVPKPEDA